MAIIIEKIQFSQLVVPLNMAVFIGLGVFGSGIAYTLFYVIVQRGGPEFATTVTYLIPFCSLLWGAIFLTEKIYWNMILGLLLILTGIYLTGRNTSKKDSQSLGLSASKLKQNKI